MFRIEKSCHFYAAHFLRGLPEGHKCARLHGHSYRVVLVVESQKLKSPGFVRPFDDLDRFESLVKERFDHRTLNDTAPFDTLDPTTEHLAKHLFQLAQSLFPETVEVRVSETESSWVIYRAESPDDPYEF